MTDDEVFAVQNPTRHTKHLRRNNAFRRRRSKRIAKKLNNHSEAEVNSTEEDQPLEIYLDRCQDLSRALNPLVPLAPEALQVHPLVQMLTHPLQAVQEHLHPTDDQPQSPVPCNPRRSRIPFKYKVYSNSGVRLTNEDMTSYQSSRQREGKKTNVPHHQ